MKLVIAHCNVNSIVGNCIEENALKNGELSSFSFSCYNFDRTLSSQKRGFTLQAQSLTEQQPVAIKPVPSPVIKQGIEHAPSAIVKHNAPPIVKHNPPPVVKPEVLKKIPETIKKVPIPDTKTQITKPRIVNTNSHKVAITSFIRSNCVYIRDADEETTNRFQLIHRVVDQLGQNLCHIKCVPEEGTFLIMGSSDGFKRCIVQEVKGERLIKVFMTDSGRQEIVSINQLFEPGSRLEKLAETSFIKMLKLENVPEFYLNQKAADYVKSILGDNIFLGKFRLFLLNF